MEIKIVIDDRLIHAAGSRLRSRPIRWAIALALFLVPLAGLIAEGTTNEPAHTFVPGAPISATQVNENFQELYSSIGHVLDGNTEKHGDLYAIDGNIGIGTTSPEGRLHVHDDVVLGFGDTNCPDGYFLAEDRDGSGDPTMDDLCSSDGLVVKENSRVGIGARDPEAALDIRASGDRILVLRSGSTSDTRYYYPLTVENPTTREFVVRGTSTTADYAIQLENPGEGKMNLLVTDGSVGIGTTEPGAELDVSGAIGLDGFRIFRADLRGGSEGTSCDKACEEATTKAVQCTAAFTAYSAASQKNFAITCDETGYNYKVCLCLESPFNKLY